METIGLSRSTLYFKINLYKFVKKYPSLKNPTLAVNNNFKKIKFLCKKRGNKFM